MEAELLLLSQAKKPDAVTRLVIEAAGIFLGNEPEVLPAYKVPVGSVYGPTLSLLCQDFNGAITKLKDYDVLTLSNDSEEKLLKVVETHEFNDVIDTSISTPELIGTLRNIVNLHLEVLKKAALLSKRLNPYTNLLVAVDGSRMSNKAFHTACQMRRFGKLLVFHVEEVNENQISYYSTELLEKDYIKECQLLGIPSSKYKVSMDSALLNRQRTVASGIAKRCSETDSDVLVLGSFGRNGPQVEQLGHTPLELIETISSIKIPIVVVSPCSDTEIPIGAVKKKSDSDGKNVLIAVEPSDISQRCIDAALKLTQPNDKLYLYYVSKPYSSKESSENSTSEWTARLEEANVNHTLLVEEAQVGMTVAEKIQNKVVEINASYVVFGKSGSSLEDTNDLEKNAANRGVGSTAKDLLASPRCTIILSP